MRSIHLIALMMLLASCGRGRVCSHEIVIDRTQVERLAVDAALPFVYSSEMEAEVIDANALFDNVGFDFMSIVDSIRFVPLQTNERSRMGRIEKVELTNSHIYMSDGKALFIFDRKGFFVNRIEFSTDCKAHCACVFAFDRHSDELLVLRNSTIERYSPSGTLKSTEPTSLRFTSMACNGSTHIFFNNISCNNSHLKSLMPSTLFEIDSNGHLSHHGLPSPMGVKSALFGQGIRRYTDHALVSRSFCDTIYRYDAAGLYPRYVINFDSQKVSEQYILRDEVYFRKALMGNNKYYFDGTAIETDNSLFFKLLTYRAQTVYAFYDLRTKKLTGGMRPSANYIVIPPIYEPVSACGNDFAALYRPYQLEEGQTFRFLGKRIDEREKDKIENVRHEDNPILVLYRVRVND